LTLTVQHPVAKGCALHGQKLENISKTGSQNGTHPGYFAGIAVPQTSKFSVPQHSKFANVAPAMKNTRQNLKLRMQKLQRPGSGMPLFAG
jgi:hypothetical protein